MAIKPKKPESRKLTEFCPAAFFDKDVFKVLLVLVSLYILVFVAFDYNAAWSHPEEPFIFLPNTIKTGVSLSWNDLSHALNWYDFDLNPRPRFVDYFFQILNGKLRLALLTVFPPHPSFSLNWIFVFLSPFFLFKFVRNHTSNPSTAWICILLYMVSPGFLSGISMYFHAGKPLSNFLLILCLYLASEISRRKDFPEPGSKVQNRFIILLFFVLFIASYTDEMAWFIYICLPVLFYRLYFFPSVQIPGPANPEATQNKMKSMRKQKKTVLLPITSPANRNSRYPMILPHALLAFSVPICLLSLVPYLYRKFSIAPGSFPFLSFFSGTHKQAEFLNFADLLYNARSLVFSSIGIPSPDFGQAWPDMPEFPLLLGLCCFFGFLIYSALHLAKNQRSFLFAGLVSLILLVIYQTLLMSHHMPRVETPYYYCSNFSILFSIVMAVLLSSAQSKLLLGLHRLILVLLLLFSAMNYQHLNASWIRLHNNSYKDFYSEQAMINNNSKPFSFNSAYRAWQARENPSELNKMRKEYPLRAVWLFVELNQM